MGSVESKRYHVARPRITMLVYQLFVGIDIAARLFTAARTARAPAARRDAAHGFGLFPFFPDQAIGADDEEIRRVAHCDGASLG